jgi:probable phosphoglycerate mutase
MEQAMLQANNLKNVSFDACFCSPQTRARQFCETIYKGPTMFDDRLAEIRCGDFEGKKETVIMMLSYWLAIKTGAKGTERYDAFIKRNCDLCDVIMKEHKGKNVLIVTHAGNVRVINYYFTGKPEGYNFTKKVIEMGKLITYEN